MERREEETMTCTTCWGRGYIRIQHDKQRQCPVCEGTTVVDEKKWRPKQRPDPKPHERLVPEEAPRAR